MKIKENKKCIVMLSGGLDSRLAVKIMQEQGFDVTALFFKLPFGTGCCDEGCSFNFSQMQGVKLEIFDCARGKLLQEYLECIRNPKYGRGAGVNPCVDCRVFMFSKAREFADKVGIDLIVSGEVLGERPMSQMMKSIRMVEEKSGLKGRLLRPLSAKLLEETNAEKEGLVDRDKLYEIQGRRRVEQIKLANRFKIKYPHPAGGCLLCEKDLKNRFGRLLERGIGDNEIHLVGIGRHFKISPSEKEPKERKKEMKKKEVWDQDDVWVVLGRNKDENVIIEAVGKKVGKLVIPDFIGPSCLVLGRKNKDIMGIVDEMIWAYSKKGSLEERKKFDKWRL